MTAYVQRAILKGHLAGTVATRNMFTADVQLETPDTYEDVWQHYLGDIWTPIRPYLSTLVTMDTFQVQQLTSGVWVDIGEYDFADTGTGSGDMLPNIVAGVLIGKCAGRIGHGRKFFSGLIESSVAGNVLVGAAVTGFATSLLAYITSYVSPNGSSVAPGIVTKDGAFHLFLTGYVTALLGSMRRRKPGLGI